MRSVVIIGGGLIGQQWAILFASNKFDVIIYEISSKQIEVGKAKIRKDLEKYIDMDICRHAESCESQISRIQFTSILDELPKDAEFIMECVPEDLKMKTDVFAMLDSVFCVDSVRMSSSSYMPISRFTSDLKNKHKCIIAHPINPPYFLRLVEIVPATYTDRSTIDKVKNLMELLGQVPIVLKKEVEGFALNRIQSAVYNSIFTMLKEDIVSVGDVDKIFTEALAPRWTFFGPLLVSALNGPGAGNYFLKYLSSIDKVNEDQGYPPQSGVGITERIVNEMNKYDSKKLSQIIESRDSLLGNVLKMKVQQSD